MLRRSSHLEEARETLDPSRGNLCPGREAAAGSHVRRRGFFLSLALVISQYLPLAWCGQSPAPQDPGKKA